MRRLFIALLALPFLAGCDGLGPEAGLAGTWEVVSVQTFDGEVVEGPVGSKLVMSERGGLEVISANRCSGGSFGVTPETPIGPMIDFRWGGCTEGGFPVVDDLSLFVHTLAYPDGGTFFGHGPYTFRYLLEAHGPDLMDVQVQASRTTLTFRRVR